MDFGKKQLLKFGWKDGDGLGKDNQGITNCIKPNLKFDNNGLGFDKAEEFNNHWWEKVYNKAASNIEVDSVSKNVCVTVKDPEAVEITNKSFSKKDLKKRKNGEYGNFVNTTTLSGLKEELALEQQKETDIPIQIETVISDEMLFKVCGGRTAHKGARHGLKMSGKLARLAQQEEEYHHGLKKVKVDNPIAENDTIIVKKKKKSKRKNLDK